MKTICQVRHGQCPLTKATGPYDGRLRRTTIKCSHCGTRFALPDADRLRLMPDAFYDQEEQAWMQDSGFGGSGRKRPGVLET